MFKGINYENQDIRRQTEDLINNLNPMASYRSYVAKITQSGVDAPIAEILYNSLGFVPVWSYQSVGRYELLLPNTDSSKVFIPCPFQNDISEQFVGTNIINIGDDGKGNCRIWLQQCDISVYNSPAEFDGIASSPSFEIRIY